MKEYEGRTVEVLVEGESKITLTFLPAIRKKQARQLQRAERRHRQDCTRQNRTGENMVA